MQILSRIVFPWILVKRQFAGLKTIDAIPNVGRIFTLHVISQGGMYDEIADAEKQARELLEDLHSKEEFRESELTDLVRVDSPHHPGFFFRYPLFF